MKINGSLSKFYQYAFPMSTVLVTCIDDTDKPNCITVSWHTPLSKKPPLHGISIAPQRYSHLLITEGKEFCINFLHNSQVMQAQFCGTHSGRSLE
ncbi:MAG: flavin reductase family protein, partial [Candidatus Thermoplasmatota archaeon]|nr:flavin reductase family protein [Candidatus Thermoplasmatota archaeon]